MVEYRDHRKAKSRKQWTEVAVFTEQPRDNPRESKDCHVLAKFAHAGDAYVYASNIVKMFREDEGNTYHKAWAVVVR